MPQTTPDDQLAQRYMLAGLSSGEAVWDWDLGADTLFLSPGFREHLGLPASGGAVCPRDWFGRVHPDDLQWLEATLRPRHDEGGRRFIIEHRVRNGRGDWTWLLVRGSAIAGPDGKVTRVIGTAADITERKEAEEKLRVSEERLALAAAATNDGLYDWDLRTDRIYYAPRWWALIGLLPEEEADGPEEWLNRVHPEDLIWLQATLDAQMSAGGKPFQIEYRIQHGRGGWRWMLCRGIAVMDASGEPVRLVGSQSDITDRKVAEEQLRMSEERYALASQGANDGLWDWRVQEGEVYYSPRWSDMLGLPGGEWVGTMEDWFALVHASDLPGLRAAFELHLSGGLDHLEHEVRIRHDSGAELWVLIRGVAIRDALGDAIRMAGSMTDITARKRAEQQILFDAFHDGLTGLPNRSLLMDRIGQTIDRRRRPDDPPCAVILFDLDHFKTVNDSLGPNVGDEVLRILAKRLEDQRRAGDTIARVSADEFGVLMDGVVDVKAAMTAALRLSSAIAEPIRLPGMREELVLTASGGIAMSHTGYGQAPDMLRDASLAMFRAKGAGRNRVEVFDDALRARAMSRLRTEADLRLAADRHQLTLFYQPIVRLSDQSIAGFEALIRWMHPERGMISPADFVPLAEDTGLILQIGRWAMQEAAEQLARWQKNHDSGLFMSVNVSGRQMLDDDMVDCVRHVLADTGVAPDTLKLEITESLLMDDPGRAVAMMQQIRSLGVHLSLDDFGTGYSSLSYLHRYPVNSLKIDRAFISGAGNGDRREEIPRIILLLAKSLDLDVVAEGIESPSEVAFLRGLECRYGQGYYFSRPIPADAAEKLLALPSLPGINPVT
ncbi:EAL domain-containing protein [Niveispirillum sp.]|uniref:sensor domain-containing protein n=1 Tax=Niveispirillum sp. TaxID=1917217 RepID=UPI0025DBDB16|nr:EAL domain-containing protein [Niveispirillum sp.]